jgi:hypothetical protein
VCQGSSKVRFAAPTIPSSTFEAAAILLLQNSRSSLTCSLCFVGLAPPPNETVVSEAAPPSVHSFNPVIKEMLRSFLTRVLLPVLLVLFGSSTFAQSLRVIAPNGGESWEAGTTQTVRWESSGINDELEIEYTVDGSQWRRIARVSSSTNQVSWTVENRPTEIAQVRVITKEEDVSDVSDGVFTITPDPLDQTLLFSPNGGEILTEGETFIIRWQLPLDAIDALLEYSTNFGVSWAPITTIAASLGQYSWNVPNVASTAITTAVVRVSVAEALDHFDISDAAFTIKPKVVITPAALSITYPNGGEALDGGSTVNVTWGYAPASNEGENEGPEIMVQYSTDKGSTWKDIATEDAKSGSHSWLVPNVSTTLALVRVIQVGGMLGDTSNATFTINASSVGTTSLTVTSPNGGEVWREGELHDITWTNQGENDEAKIFLETTDQKGDTKKEQLASIAASAGTISWAVPALGEQPLQARIIVEAEGVADISDAPFVILPKGSLSVSRSAKDVFELRGFYPNPATDVVTFSWAPSNKNAVVGKLYNSSGAVVRTTSVSGHSSMLSIQVKDLPQGAYFYELVTEGHIARGLLNIER